MRVAAGIVLALSLPLAGCLSLGQVADRGTTFDQSVGELSNRAVLLNIARASRHDPLYFVSVGNAQATGSSDLRVGLPPVTFGPGLTVEQKQIAFGFGGSSSYDQNTNTDVQLGVYNTHDFYVGLMSPLRLDEIDLLLRQGFPRELVFMLTIDKARVTPPSGRPYYIYNDPQDPARYALFVRAIQTAMEHGLTTEIAPVQPATPASAETGKAVPQVVQQCFDRALATEAANAEFDQLSAAHPGMLDLCGSGAASGKSQAVYFDGPDKPPSQVEVVFRSTYGIFQYLGGVIAAPDAATPQLVDYHIPGETTPAGPLLQVSHGGGALGTGCFTAVTYGGEHFCVPAEGDMRNTKDVFGILVALIGLKQAPGDLPSPQAVLLAP
jgi:hypothetical protein